MLELSLKEQKQTVGGKTKYGVYTYYRGELTGIKVFNSKKEASKYAAKISNPSAGLSCVIKKVS